MRHMLSPVLSKAIYLRLRDGGVGRTGTTVQDKLWTKIHFSGARVALSFHT
jgi:hypothetical protein